MAVLGSVFETHGWSATNGGIGAALLLVIARDAQYVEAR